MSKFARLKSKFEKEKLKNVKSCKKKENPKTKKKMTITPVRQAATATTNTTSTLTTKDTHKNVPPTKPLFAIVPPTTTKQEPTTKTNHHQNHSPPSDVSLTRFPSNMWEPNGNHRVQIRYGGTASVPPGTTLHNMAHCAGLKTPKITNITPTTSTHAPQGSLPSNRQQKPPHLVPPKVWGDSSDDSEPPRNVATLSARRVGDIVKMFGTTTDVKTTTTPGRWPATRKTAGNATRNLEEEDDLGTPQGVPKKS